MREPGKFPMFDDQNNVGAVAKVIVKQFGFSSPGPFRATVVPVLYLQCQMVSKVIWSSSDRVLTSASTQVDAVLYDRLVNDAAL